MSYTTGKWGYHFNNEDFTITNNTGKGIAYVRIDDDGTFEEGYMIPEKEAKANAKLIAAAPDLLEALEIAKETIEHFVQVTGQNFDNTLRIINNTIEKATGKKGGV